MPTYEYACKECGEHLEIVQKFSDDALTECPACGGPLRKVFGNVGIVFKGSGFYKNDSRNASVGSSPPAPSTAASESSSGTSSDSTSTTPAPAAPATPAPAAPAATPSTTAS